MSCCLACVMFISSFQVTWLPPVPPLPCVAPPATIHVNIDTMLDVMCVMCVEHVMCGMIVARVGMGVMSDGIAVDGMNGMIDERVHISHLVPLHTSHTRHHPAPTRTSHPARISHRARISPPAPHTRPHRTSVHMTAAAKSDGIRRRHGKHASGNAHHTTLKTEATVVAQIDARRINDHFALVAALPCICACICAHDMPCCSCAIVSQMSMQLSVAQNSC